MVIVTKFHQKVAGVDVGRTSRARLKLTVTARSLLQRLVYILKIAHAPYGSAGGLGGVSNPPCSPVFAGTIYSMVAREKWAAKNHFQAIKCDMWHHSSKLD